MPQRRRRVVFAEGGGATALPYTSSSSSQQQALAAGLAASSAGGNAPRPGESVLGAAVRLSGVEQKLGLPAGALSGSLQHDGSLDPISAERNEIIKGIISRGGYSGGLEVPFDPTQDPTAVVTPIDPRTVTRPGAVSTMQGVQLHEAVAAFNAAESAGDQAAAARAFTLLFTRYPDYLSVAGGTGTAQKGYRTLRSACSGNKKNLEKAKELPFLREVLATNFCEALVPPQRRAPATATAAAGPTPAEAAAAAIKSFSTAGAVRPPEPAEPAPLAAAAANTDASGGAFVTSDGKPTENAARALAFIAVLADISGRDLVPYVRAFAGRSGAIVSTSDPIGAVMAAVLNAASADSLWDLFSNTGVGAAAAMTALALPGAAPLSLMGSLAVAGVASVGVLFLSALGNYVSGQGRLALEQKSPAAIESSAEPQVPKLAAAMRDVAASHGGAPGPEYVPQLIAMANGYLPRAATEVKNVEKRFASAPPQQQLEIGQQALQALGATGTGASDRGRRKKKQKTAQQ